jgi:hypothetical protein
MADDEIRRLQRVAERCGPKAFLLALLNPDAPDGGLLRRAGVNARAIVRAYLDYVDGQEHWKITQVVGERRRLHVTVEAVDEATGRSRSHHFKRWARADTYEKQRDNDLYGRLLEALVKVGADPVLHETWVGKVLLVHDAWRCREHPVPG